MSGSKDKTIRVWRISSGICIKILIGHKKEVRCVVFSPDGENLASGSRDNTIRI